MTRAKASTPPCWRPRPSPVFWRRWGGEVLLVDCRRDHIDCRLNHHYPLDAIFLSCQRPTLGEQLVSLPHRTSGRFRFPPFMLIHFGLGGRQVAQASERECALWLTQRCFLHPRCHCRRLINHWLYLP